MHEFEIFMHFRIDRTSQSSTFCTRSHQITDLLTSFRRLEVHSQGTWDFDSQNLDTKVNFRTKLPRVHAFHCWIQQKKAVFRSADMSLREKPLKVLEACALKNSGPERYLRI
jgi:hypothetical protein